MTSTRARAEYRYGRGGGLVGLTVDRVGSYVKDIVYDAHGRRSIAFFGNGVLVRYGYDPRTLRLRRLRAEHATSPATGATWSPWRCRTTAATTWKPQRPGRRRPPADHRLNIASTVSSPTTHWTA